MSSRKKNSRRAKPSSTEPVLPDWIDRAMELANALEQAAFAPFPELDPEAAKHCDKVGHLMPHWRQLEPLRECIDWGRAVARIVRGHVPYEEKRQDAEGLAHVNKLDIRAHAARAFRSAETLHDLFSTALVGGAIDFPRNVFGPPHHAIRNCCNAGALTDIWPDVFEAQDPDRLEWPPWPELVRNVHFAYLSIRTQALLVVDWVRGETTRLTDAMLPIIEMPKSPSRSHVPVVVKLAGRTRREEITWTHYLTLRDLMDEGEAVQTRNLVRGKTRRALLHRLPELQELVKSVPGAAGTGQKALYAIPAIMRSRIVLMPTEA